LIKFFLVILATALVFGGVVWSLQQQQMLEGLPSFFYTTLLFLVLGTGLVYTYLYKSDKSVFIQTYMLTMVLKLLAYLAYAFIMVMQDKEGAFANVVFFMVLYFTYTLLELVFLYRRISD